VLLLVAILPAWLKWPSLFQESSLIFVRRESTLWLRLRPPWERASRASRTGPRCCFAGANKRLDQGRARFRLDETRSPRPRTQSRLLRLRESADQPAGPRLRRPCPVSCPAIAFLALPRDSVLALQEDGTLKHATVEKPQHDGARDARGRRTTGPASIGVVLAPHAGAACAPRGMSQLQVDVGRRAGAGDGPTP
jgi:hypothetical protein